MIDYLSQRAAARLRNEIDLRKLTRKALTDMTGLSINRLTDLASGLRSWTLNDIEAVAKALDMPAEAFIAPDTIWSKATPEQLDAPLVFPSRVDRRDGTPLVVPDDEAVAA